MIAVSCDAAGKAAILTAATWAMDSGVGARLPVGSRRPRDGSGIVRATACTTCTLEQHSRDFRGTLEKHSRHTRELTTGPVVRLEHVRKAAELDITFR